MTDLWGFDFGKVTGVSLGHYGANQPYELSDVWHVQSGLNGFIDWWRHDELIDTSMSTESQVVAEQFALNPGESNMFLPDLAGVPIEGALAALSPAPIHWQLRSAKQKKGMYDSILKEHGLWQDGGSVNWTDGRDANDAITHSLEFLRATVYHLPTLRKYFQDEYNGV